MAALLHLGPALALLSALSDGITDVEMLASLNSMFEATRITTAPDESYYPHVGRFGNPALFEDGQVHTLSTLPSELVGLIGEYCVEPFTGEETPCGQCGETGILQSRWGPKGYDTVCTNGHVGQLWCGGHRSLKQLTLCSRFIRDATKHLLHSHLSPPMKDTIEGLPTVHLDDLACQLVDGPEVNFRLECVQSFSFDRSGRGHFTKVTAKLLCLALAEMHNVRRLIINFVQHRSYEVPPIDFTGVGQLTRVKSLVIGDCDSGLIDQCPNVEHIATTGRHNNTHGLRPNSPKVGTRTQDFVRRLRECKHLKTLDMQTDWNSELMKAVASAQPNLTRLGMMGNMLEWTIIDFGVAGPRTWAPGVPPELGVTDPSFHLCLELFKKLEVLVLPYVTRVGVFNNDSSVTGADCHELLRVRDSDPDLEDVIANDPHVSGESNTAVRMRTIFNKAYEVTAEHIFQTLPGLQQLWFDRFLGVNQRKDTNSLRDVCVTRSNHTASFAINRDVLLPRASDGTLPYGSGSITYPDWERADFVPEY